MKLNPDCIRDILMSGEEVCEVDCPFESDKDMTERLQAYSYDELIYHARQCEMACLIIRLRISDFGRFTFDDLTPSGHEFLANIHNDTIWKGVKETAVKVGSTSLSALTQIATNVITTLIKTQFGLP